MGAHGWGFDARSLNGAPDQLRDGAAGRKRTKRCRHSHKDMRVINPRPKVLEIVPNGIANLLRKWQPALTATFPDNADVTLRPVNVCQQKVSNIACSQAQSGEQQDYRAVARAHCAVWITGPNESLYIGGIDITRQGGEPPLGDTGNRANEVWRTISVCS